MMTPSLRDILLLCLCLVDIQAKGLVKLCYFPSWAGQRVSEYARFNVQDIDPSLCTHLVYAFATLDVDNLRIANDGEQTVGKYQRFNSLKNTNRDLKTLISIGGEYAPNDQFVAIAKDDSSSQLFARSTVDFLRKEDFDGLDIDWEYPTASTKDHFSRLLKALRTAFDDEQRSSGKERLLLTVAMPAGKQRIQGSYDIAELSKYVDLASLMTYDYHGGWNSVTGFDSPLYSRRSNRQFNQELSTEWTVDYYQSLGLQASKILVGITGAGTRFKLQNPNITGVGAPVIKSDRQIMSDMWKLPNRYAYPEICLVLKKPGSERVFDAEQKVPYAFHGEDWSGYEDVQSIEGKADWMLKKGVAGAMFWALDMDDFTGRLCGQGPFPLLHALDRKLVVTPEPQEPGDVDDGSNSGTRTRGSSAAWFLHLIATVIVALRSTSGCCR